MKIILVITAFLLFADIATMSPDYYLFLRVVVCIVSLLAIFLTGSKKFSVWTLLFAGIAFLFNPVYPLFPEKETLWIVLDLAAGIIMIARVMMLKTPFRRIGRRRIYEEPEE